MSKPPEPVASRERDDLITTIRRTPQPSEGHRGHSVPWRSTAAVGVVATVILGAAYLWPVELNSQPKTATPMPAVNALAPAVAARFADFGSEKPSAEARYVADWVADSQNSNGLNFIVVDKKNATVYVFDATARLRGASPVLLGAAKGDDSVPGIGTRPIAQVRPAERTTPAGRFLAERGRNNLGEDIVWVDYDAAVSIHRVRATNKKERRLERLATPTTSDNRISYGCVNVPVAFYESTIRPVFATHRAVVYVLPEVKSMQELFGAYDVAVVHGLPPR